MNTYEVSVIIPCYNYGQYLSDAIESVLHQEGSCPTFEIIVVNDHSSEAATLSVLDRWKNAEGPIRVIDNRGEHGIGAARNLGVEVARGEWLAFLDADDVWLPEALAARWKALEGFPEAQWISADFLVWQEDGSRDTKGYFESGALSSRLLSAAYRDNKVLQLRKPVSEFLQTSLAWTGVVMVKRSLLKELGGFETKLKRAQDLHMWARLALEADFHFVPKPVALYRQHPASVTHEDQAPEVWSIRAYSMLLGNPNFSAFQSELKRKLAFYHGQNSHFHRKRSQKWKALQAAAMAVCFDPARLILWRNLVAACLLRK